MRAGAALAIASVAIPIASNCRRNNLSETFRARDSGGVFPANWPGITAGSSVTVGAELSGTFTGSGRVADASPAEFEEAYEPDHRLELQATTNLFENRDGLGKKWLHGEDGWYFITEDAGFYA